MVKKEFVDFAKLILWLCVPIPKVLIKGGRVFVKQRVFIDPEIKIKIIDVNCHF